MSEVKRYEWSPDGTGYGYFEGDEPQAGQLYTAADFDRVTAERDAALAQLSEQQNFLHREVLANDHLIQRLTAAEKELDQCQSMALMIEEKEWAEHVGKGPISSQVESAFTQLHNELSEARQVLTAADELLDQAVTALNEIARVSRMGEKPFEIATLAIGEISALNPAQRHPCPVSLDGCDGACKPAEGSTCNESTACPKCNGTGEADSGGVHPWGEGINIPCDCKQ